ncbi:histidinol phosphatase [hydrocarbon metagenome]|uniref:Histidinol phosphatase n=1 Tax=hydrocarbon metagenome TaxID=938273 RepID=A0A0W8FZL5_9ZZZZ
MEIINPGKEDYHIHSFNFSDGMSTVDEIVKFAGEIGLEKIAITDHCQVHQNKRKFVTKNYYNMIDRWKNIHNNVKVIFGVEGDLLNEKGDVCMDIQNITPEIIILSSHPAPVYNGDSKKITEAYLNAIERYHNKIAFLGHPCSKYFEDDIQIMPIIELCNKYDLPMEFNCANLVYKKTNLQNLDLMLKNIKRIYVNSDAHMLNELKELRRIGFQYLSEKGYN